ncbi:sugar phosphate isomerase/epimerase [Pseudonocardia sp. N23]|uniref:sugar phosphate isomerase/epimerase family protein n=1 Tax=Pseudonocardia sp. N23 TaxID=1987376 RepID=UPI000BFE0A5B|nr:TIM barrel protein [Pseudonocardia sp. N23]GAY08322.1 xylose isomerase domain protein TIM barrel [Pseudonocardia sp. N23]
MISLAAGTVLDAGPGATIDAAAAAGYDAAGLRLDADTGPAAAGALRRRADDQGLALLDLEVVRLGPDRGIDEALRLLDLAVVLGARFLLTVSGHPDPADTRAELATLVAAAHGGPTRVGLEFMRFTTVATLAAAVATLDDIGADPADAAVLVDALHLRRSGGSPADVAAVTAVAPGRIGYVQVCDGPATGPGTLDAVADEARHHRLPPGDGDLPLRDLLAATPAGLPVSVEVQSDRLAADLDPTARARVLLDATRRALPGQE